jgi:hypothetical protein
MTIPNIWKNKGHVPNHIHHPYIDGVRHPFEVKLGMVYYCFTKLIPPLKKQGKGFEVTQLLYE